MEVVPQKWKFEDSERKRGSLWIADFFLLQTAWCSIPRKRKAIIQVLVKR